MECNCSLCRRLGALWHGASDSSLRITAGENELTLYQFNTMTAKHYFCPHCGVHPFSRPRLDPSRWAVNIRCIDGADLSSLPLQAGSFTRSVKETKLAIPGHGNGPHRERRYGRPGQSVQHRDEGEALIALASAPARQRAKTGATVRRRHARRKRGWRRRACARDGSLSGRDGRGSTRSATARPTQVGRALE